MATTAFRLCRSGSGLTPARCHDAPRKERRRNARRLHALEEAHAGLPTASATLVEGCGLIATNDALVRAAAGALLGAYVAHLPRLASAG